MRWLTNDFTFKWTATAAIGIQHTKVWLSQLVIFKMQSDTLEERYAIKFCFKLGKNATENAWNASDCFSTILAWIEYQFLSGIRDSKKAGTLWEMMRGVGGVKKSIDHSWLAKGLELGLGLLCWGFKGVLEEIPWEEASTLQIGSEQCISQQLHPCPQTIWPRWASRKFLTHPVVQTLFPSDFWLFPKLRGCRYETIEEMKEAVTKAIDTLTHKDFHEAFQKLLERYNNIAAVGN